MTKTLDKITAPAEVSPDLSKPSLKGLAWLLRHPAMWPGGFEWHYACVGHCALGLAVEVWGDVETAIISGWGSEGLRVLNLPSPRNFNRWSPQLLPFYGMSHRATPGDVADKIDDYLETIDGKNSDGKSR